MLFNQDNNRALRNALLTTSAAAAVLLFGSSISWAQDSNTNTAAPNDTSKDASKSSATVSEVVVTGTNIKGVKPIDPVITITRQDIDESGYATIGDVMRSLPEDFAGGQNPGVVNANQYSVNDENTTNGSSVDLFGLGSDATLTLINGHRMPSDGFYQAADISVIPLGAIDRVELVTDGSSAIYGSDAVAGVVNFILRKDYQGLEVSAYYGGATEGGDQTQIYSVLAGVTKDHWHFLLNAEYQHQDPITASERAFTSTAYDATTLISPQTSKTVFISGGVDITDKISFSLDGVYSDRESGTAEGFVPYLIAEGQLESPNANVTETLDFKLPRGWDLSVVGTEASSSTTDTYEDIEGAAKYTGKLAYRNSFNSIDTTANGKVMTLPTGDLHMAVGGGYREEGFKSDYPGNPAYDADDVQGSRSVAYAYGEALLPLVPASADRLGLQQLVLSASGRYEHYSDFGDTANPKLGLRYVPFTGLNIRATWGTSFEAPSLTQVYQATEVIYESAKSYGGTGDALMTYGGNANLKPETSKNWTIGAEYIPPILNSMTLSVTYFNVNYSNRIVAPVNSVNQSTFLTNPDDAAFVTVNPSAAQDQSLIASTPLFESGLGPYNQSTVNYIFQDSYQNAEAQLDTGVDVSYRESFELGIGHVRTFANATWNHLTQQLSPGEAFETLSGTLFNVPNFRGRGGVSWSDRGFTATAIVNYTSSETDALVKPNRAIASLTTVDANLAYKFRDSSGFLHGLAFAVSVTNLFDKTPPYVPSPNAEFGGLDYDSLNASAVGRFIAFKVTKKL